MSYDFNLLEKRAKELIGDARWKDALRIYLVMADGDHSLDGGYLGEKIGECYDALGDLAAAKFWYGRAVEENPEVRITAASGRKRLQAVNIDDLIQPSGGKALRSER